MPVVTDYTALLSGYSWGGIEVTGRPVFLTYSFPTAAPPGHSAPVAMGAGVATFQAFDAADQAVARQALAEWADACGVTLFEVGPGKGDIEFAWYDFAGTPHAGAAGFAFYPGGSYDGTSYPYLTDRASTNGLAGDVFLDPDYAGAGGSPVYGLLLHEIGHALGFKHPFEIFGSHDETLAPALDTTASTVMSYTGPSPTQLGSLDVAAAVAVYGAASSDGTQVAAWSWSQAKERLTQTGSAGADTVLGVSVADRITGGGGADLLIGYEGRDVVAGGLGDDLIHGGADNDQLLGDDGNDTLHGGAGRDKLSGGAGNDVLWGEAGKDRFAFGAGFGNDSIADFEDGRDRMDLSGVPGVAGIGDVTISPAGASAAFVAVGSQGTIVVFGAAAAQLTAADFIF